MIDDSLENKYEIEKEMEKSDDEWENENYNKSIDHLLNAWNMLPEPKTSYTISYHLADELIISYLQIKDNDNASKWIEVFFKCDPERIDSGEREFLAGKVAYSSNKTRQAIEYFKIANKKSRGRCFADEDKKYKALIENNNEFNNYDEVIKNIENLFNKKQYFEALELIFDALNFDEGLDNSYIYLRKGQCHFELEQFDESADALTRAFMLDGIDLFSKEDTKYIEFLKTKIDI